MLPHQTALVDQAIRYALTRYDDQHKLLRASGDARLLAVPESLCFAALLLTRAAANQGRRSELGLARLLIDSVLPLQNRSRRDPDRGLFPLVCSSGSDRKPIMDPDSREMVGSLLGLLTKDYGLLLGEKRCERVRDAIRLAMRDKRQSLPASTSGAMIAAWLELEFGDRWRGEKLATEVALLGAEQMSRRRFGDARAFARELWALSLWRRCNPLHDSVALLTEAVMADVESYAHPRLPEIFGAVTTLPGSPVNAYPWLASWLAWYAIGAEPIQPKQLRDPLHATLFAFPALAKLKLDPAAHQLPDMPEREHPLQYVEGARSITGWWEPDLHIEARRSDGVAGSRVPVAGARWRSREGSSVWMQCRVAKQESAVCRKRFVHLRDPGTTIVSVHNMPAGEARMIDNGWWLSNLHFATEGFELLGADRSDQGLELKLRPTSDEALLMLSPLQ